jgi:S1-C subfamily serine protease
MKVAAANDLALLKVAKEEGRMKNEETFKPLPIAASRTVKLGGTVATVGFPDIGLQGFAPKLAKGEIASLAGAADDPRYFQISVPVQPGNSGGALVDERGNVIGIVSAKLDAAVALAASGALPENVNYAVKSWQGGRCRAALNNLGCAATQPYQAKLTLANRPQVCYTNRPLFN